MASKPAVVQAQIFSVRIEGEDLGIFNEDELTLEDAFIIENTTKLGVVEMLAGFRSYQAKPLRALAWFMYYKAGKTKDLSAINFKLTQFETVPVENPTVPAGKRGSGETSTSEPSPSTAT